MLCRHDKRRAEDYSEHPEEVKRRAPLHAQSGYPDDVPSSERHEWAGQASLWIGSLPDQINTREKLYEFVTSLGYGKVDAGYVAVTATGALRGFGYIHCAYPIAKALSELKDVVLHGSHIKFSLASPESRRLDSKRPPHRTLFLQNLPHNITSNDIKELFPTCLACRVVHSPMYVCFSLVPR
jgi:RNA recognition motif-containing protein